uniref:TM2 domain-containing protein n=1 Tax=Aliarcobacter sp. TaxID=2321116 RepID=UPI004047DAEB
MKGKILDFNIQNSAGVISAEDGNRYTFSSSQWKSNKSPSVNQTVDFSINEDVAESIYLVSSSSVDDGSKSKIVAGILALFLGGFGVHKFYLGCTTAGIIMLAIFIFGFIAIGIPSLVIGIIAFIEALIYFFKSDDDFKEIYIDNKKCWF